MAFGACLDGKLVGGCYVSNAYNSLFIEQLFVDKFLQYSNYYIGTNLLSYVLNNRNIIESYFQTTFSNSMLESRVSNSSIYKKLDYRSNFLFVQRKYF